MNDPSDSPMGRLLVSYVLKSIGCLDEAADRQLQDMAPQFAQALGVNGASWTDIVEAAMEFPDTVPAQISKVWADGKANADASGNEIDPMEFAQQMVEMNFS